MGVELEVGRTTGRLSGFIEEQREHNRDMKAAVASMDARLHRLEGAESRAAARAAGRATMVSAAISGAGTIVTAILSGAFAWKR